VRYVPVALAALSLTLFGCSPVPSPGTLTRPITGMDRGPPRPPSPMLNKTVTAERSVYWAHADLNVLVIDDLSVVAYAYSDGTGDARASWSAVHIYNLPSVDAHFYADLKQSKNGRVTERVDFGGIHNDCADLGSEVRSATLTSPELLPSVSWIGVGLTGGFSKC
jgi:hypothetical protein